MRRLWDKVSGLEMPGTGEVRVASWQGDRLHLLDDTSTRPPHHGAGLRWGKRSIATANLAWQILAGMLSPKMADVAYPLFSEDVLEKIAEPWFVLTRDEVEAWLVVWVLNNVDVTGDPLTPGVEVN